MKYAVTEHFYTWQGEGVHMGAPAYFVRLHGCPVQCPWCDSAGTWHPDWKPAHIPIYDEHAIVELVKEGAGTHRRRPFVVLTGGEPSMYDLEPLLDRLHFHCWRVHVETAGVKPLPLSMDWITLSPKPFAVKPHPETVQRADEIKIIVDSVEAIQAGLESVAERRSNVPVWLHPEWGHRHDADILNAITEAVKDSDYGTLRAGYQLHKLYMADNLDANSLKTIIPLGGDVNRGSAI